MHFSIQTSSETAIYQQIIQRIQRAIVKGQIKPGQALPSVRALAASLKINPSTVAKAYKSLEANGVLTTKGSKGTFVKQTASLSSLESIERKTLHDFERVITQAQQDGLSKQDILDLFQISLSQSHQQL